MDISALDAKTIISERVLAEVFDIEDEIDRQFVLNEMEDKAKVLGVLTKFKSLVSVYKREEKRLKKEQAQMVQARRFEPNIVDYALDGPEDILKCGSWIADMDGVRTIIYDREVIACYHPIYIKNRLVNAETNKEKVVIAYYKKSGNSGSWKEITVDKGIIASANKIVKLADYGIAVNSENSKFLVKFLSDLENLNTEVVPLMDSTSKLGWIGGSFVPYDRNIIFDSKDRFLDLYNSIQAVGDAYVWFDLVKKLRSSNRYEVNLYLAGAFASVLVQPLNVLPFILNLWGETGQGKTVSLMVACSVWANPGENKYITDPSSTVIALEVRENILNNMPLMIDDLSKTRDKYADGFTDLVYLLCSGKGKDRSNIGLGLEASSKWKNITITNMERPLATETMRGGAINRILDFEMMDGDIFIDAQSVVDTITQSYGHAGEMFIDALNDIGIESIKQIQDEFLSKIRTAAPNKEEKQRIPLSVLLTADKIATDYVFKDGQYLDFDFCVKQLKSVNEVSENKRAYEYIMSEIDINVNNFKEDWADQKQGQIWGMFEEFNNNPYCLIHTNKFKEICNKGNFSSKAFLKWAEKNNLIIRNNGENDYLYRKRTEGHIVSFYALKMLNSEEIQDFQAIPIDDDCPF